MATRGYDTRVFIGPYVGLPPETVDVSERCNAIRDRVGGYLEQRLRRCRVNLLHDEDPADVVRRALDLWAEALGSRWACSLVSSTVYSPLDSLVTVEIEMQAIGPQNGVVGYVGDENDVQANEVQQREVLEQMRAQPRPLAGDRILPARGPQNWDESRQHQHQDFLERFRPVPREPKTPAPPAPKRGIRLEGFDDD